MSRVAPPKVVCVLGEAQSRRAPQACVRMRPEEMTARLDEIRSADVLWLWHTAWDGALEAALGAARAGGARIVADIADAAHERYARLLEAADIWTCASHDIARALPRLCRPMHVLPEPPDARRMELLLDQWLGDAPRAARAFALEHPGASRVPTPPVPASKTLLRGGRGGDAEVTVVVPLYNYRQYVTEALDSVRAQTLEGLDLVVVDDASTDDSAEVARRWLREHAVRFGHALLLRHGANAGLGPTRNSGFAAARTPFVLPLDADNALLPRCAERCAAALRASDAAFAYPLLRMFGDASGRMGELAYAPARFAGGNYIDALALVRKSAWASVGGYDHVRYGWEDYDLWCRFAEHGFYGVQVTEELARYRVHRGSMLRTETHVGDHAQRLAEDMQRRHPWLALQWT